MNEAKFDVVVIGAGIVGCMIARELSKYRLSVAVVDRESDVGMGQSSANSAIIHSGHDPIPGTLKAKLNVRGNHLWRDIAHDLSIPIRETGAMIVARNHDEFSALSNLQDRARTNGVPGVQILDATETMRREPSLAPGVAGALWTPTAAVVDPFQGVLAAAEHAAINGVTFLFDHEIIGMEIERGRVRAAQTSKGRIGAEWFVNAAGLYADRIAHMTGERPDFAITARKGEYFVLDTSRFTTQNVLFPVPTERGKGILVTTTTHGNTMIGPNSRVVQDKEDREATADGMATILEGARSLVPGIEAGDIIANFAGSRATGNFMVETEDGPARDFLIEASQKGMITVAGIESPGYASSPAIAEYVAELLSDSGLRLLRRSDWQDTRERPPRFKNRSHAERAALIAQRPEYGRIVCRCELITEGEIVDAMRGPIPATTYDAVKRRTWLGTGRCQGSFDYPRTMELLAQEHGVPIQTISKRGTGSEFLLRPTKAEVDA